MVRTILEKGEDENSLPRFATQIRLTAKKCYKVIALVEGQACTRSASEREGLPRFTAQRLPEYGENGISILSLFVVVLLYLRN